MHGLHVEGLQVSGGRMSTHMPTIEFSSPAGPADANAAGQSCILMLLPKHLSLRCSIIRDSLSPQGYDGGRRAWDEADSRRPQEIPERDAGQAGSIVDGCERERWAEPEQQHNLPALL